MRLHRLAVTAFGPFATTQDIDFDALTADGLFLLHGPTGAGKTSVLDAVCFALYGKVPGARQSPGTSLRSDHAPVDTPTEVLLDLTVGGRRLEILRSPAQPRPKRRGTGFTTEKAQSRLREHDATTGTWRALSRSHDEIGEEIEQLLGMSREQFCQVVLLPQGDFARFLRADAEARGRLLGKLFDTRCYAAVEERLAERRRAAEARVRAGDEHLLALAHRMEQAAAGAAGELPPPGHRPGEPGLAAAVLEWAAVARAGARDRLTVTGSALALAEHRRAAARTALDDLRERDRLQHRYADARLRHRASEAARPAHEAVLAELERARRAERVAPALTLRAAADRDHRTAAAALTAARAALPGDLADAGADQLTEAERTLRGELGALTAARRAETRGEEIGREKDRLDRAARADEDARQDDDAWLRGWEALRRAHQDELTAAQDAATRAEQLAGLLGPARRRRDAAVERDRLTAEADTADEALRAARDAALAGRAVWLDLKERRLADFAAELASALVPGDPCTVCGSADHPAPAAPRPGLVTRADEDAAYEHHTRAEEAAAEAGRRAARIHEARAAARRQARADGAPPAADGNRPDGHDPVAAELAAAVVQLELDHRGARDRASGTHAAREALDRIEREHEDRLSARHLLDQRGAARTAEREALDREQAALSEQLEQARGGARSVAERAAALERKARLIATAAEAVRAADQAARRLKEADGQAADAAYRAGFATPAEAAGALLGDPEHRALQHRADAWQAEAAAVADRLAESDARDAAALPPAEPEAAAGALAAAERAARDAASGRDTARERCAALDTLSGDAARSARELRPLREEYERVARLAALTAGTSAENERRMRLESYVLAARLEQVAAAATVRLRRMSAGRYTLTHSDARSGGRRSGLGLHVVDAWTGRERDTATLSGGETFFASLALALGLADVVTEEAGGIRLDTLFIDEGFGSLDEQTLDEVLDVLDSLRERDRSVGIVSHVADLRRRIPTQLEVVKERHGSTVVLRAGGPGD
ncbi:AAA family ATPase [Streptomyces tsukubensis]|uniref:Nuclease SbcCD subunit C n=3 Tax=Streptomyces TaxID=1883 RepID=A0A7G3UPY7_STRT9|nr:SMC family ATPase [Streptomyces tsukubensis]AZK93025.1 ATP-binding cassette family protein [Streptomyces tsukubensis]QKM70812.1 SMC family ATPase [Streptomyces tsukubensis NRRL18488]TAI41070.1 SMC family ATPase [Streptomyces tsukubensis]